MEADKKKHTNSLLDTTTRKKIRFEGLIITSMQQT